MSLREQHTQIPGIARPSQTLYFMLIFNCMNIEYYKKKNISPLQKQYLFPILSGNTSDYGEIIPYLEKARVGNKTGIQLLRKIFEILSNPCKPGKMGIKMWIIEFPLEDTKVLNLTLFLVSNYKSKVRDNFITTASIIK